MKRIPLSQGKFALVDDEDFERTSRYCWHLREKRRGSSICYAVHGQKPLRPYFLRMHHFILGVPSTRMVDHEDGNGLNNQKSNLRFCNQSQNNANQKLQRTSVSGLKGVSWCEAASKWRARIKIRQKEQHLGVFTSKRQAALAYDAQAVRLFGEFARTNQQMGLLTCP